jgi:hypothetical protein
MKKCAIVAHFYGFLDRMSEEMAGKGVWRCEGVEVWRCGGETTLSYFHTSTLPHYPNAAIPGRLLPSRYSSRAPPPVET